MIQLFLTICFILAASTASADTIKIGGSGSMIPLLNDIAKAYMNKYPFDTVEVNQKSMGQPGGIASLIAGAIDIAMSAMPLHAAQATLPIKPLEIAMVPGVVAVSNDVKARNISSQQLCDIYSGKITNWEQVGGGAAPIAAMTRPESDSTKVMFRKAFACMEDLHEGPKVQNQQTYSDMYRALETSKNAIGMVDVIALNQSEGKFKAIKVDGTSFDSAAWPFMHRNQLVISRKLKPAVKRFLEFVKSPQGEAIIKENKGKPVQFSM